MIKKIFYGWWIVLACSLIGFYVSGVVAFGFTAFFKPIAEEFGWNYTQISLAASLRGLEMGMFAPIFGYLVDRFGPRRLIFCGMITIGFGLAFVSRMNSLTMFYAGFGILALGRSACSITVLTTAVARWFRRNVGKALGILSSGTGASGTLVLLIVWLIDHYTWRTTFVILGLGAWLLAMPLSFLIRDRPEQYGYDLDGETSAQQAETPEIEDMEFSLKQALKSSTFWHVTFAETMRRVVAMGVITHIMPYLSSVGMARSGAGLVAASIPLLSILGRFGFGWFADIFDKRYVMAWSYSCSGAGLLALSYVQETWPIYPFLITFPLSWGSVGLSGAIVREYFGTVSIGKILGVLSGIGTVGLVIGPSVAGWTYDTLGSYHPIWLIFTATSVIPVVLILTIKPHGGQAG